MLVTYPSSDWPASPANWPWAKWKLMIIAGFFDDSGKESAGDARHVCLAGYLTYGPAYSSFMEEWRQLLLFHNLPYLHMREIMNPHFCKKMGWDESHRNKVLMEFVQIPAKHKFVGIGIGIDADFWRSLSKARRKAFGNCQQFAFQRVMWQVQNRLKGVGDKDLVEVTFDYDYEFSGSRLNLYQHAKKHYKWADRFINLSFGDSKHIYPLQAADLLAWETRKELLRRMDGKPSTERFKSLLALELGDQMRTKGEFWNAELAEEKISAVEKEMGLTLT